MLFFAYDFTLRATLRSHYVTGLRCSIVYNSMNSTGVEASTGMASLSSGSVIDLMPTQQTFKAVQKLKQLKISLFSWKSSLFSLNCLLGRASSRPRKPSRARLTTTGSTKHSVNRDSLVPAVNTQAERSRLNHRWVRLDSSSLCDLWGPSTVSSWFGDLSLPSLRGFRQRSLTHPHGEHSSRVILMTLEPFDDWTKQLSLLFQQHCFFHQFAHPVLSIRIFFNSGQVWTHNHL